MGLTQPDSQSLLTRATDAHNAQTTYTYNVVNSLTQVSGPGTAPPRTWNYHPTTNLLQHESDPESGTTTYGYDPAGRLTSLTDAAGNATVLTLDGDGRVTRHGAAGDR